MARAWIELPPDTGWGDVRAAIRMLDGLGYTTAEVRGARVWLRLAGSALDVSELWIMPTLKIAVTRGRVRPGVRTERRASSSMRGDWGATSQL